MVIGAQESQMEHSQKYKKLLYKNQNISSSRNKYPVLHALAPTSSDVFP